ncbi:hypothetical protein PAHAL_9G358500 [Panicum hallii]|uniref:F-box domain-containing protein n=2 Tax=Panicum hallii TaxID=206008 RepID=A0A2S3IN36_9POAL|nr:FBD-associated F-box protein At1g66310-like [Panicum hallii]PAN48095.1 hypothetical protein PAHAL_9G358500 [Panicum hallii]
MKCPCDPDSMAEASGDARMVPARAPSEACRINALPSHVLTRAISFLDARQLVRTCVLSLQWRDLWRSVPRINASREEFDGMPGTWVEQNVLFKKFFNRFLMLRNPTPLDEFNLCYGVRDSEDSTDRDYVAESEDANLWIGHALHCNARSVKVSATEWEAKLHPDPVVFASKCFLTSLELTRVVLFAGFFKNLQMGCTLLERLKLYDCPICDAEVSSQTLKLFTVDTGCFPHREQASISIPSLVDFGYFSGERIPPLLTNLGSLETATVSIGTYAYDTPLSDICQFLRGLSNVTHLDLSYEGPKLEVQANFQWCPKFNNLTTLTLGEWCLCADFYALIVFLQNSPNLMKLILEIRKNPETHEKFIGELEERYFTCEHLKIVEIICPENWEDDPMLNDLVKFLVGNGISSDHIEIKNWRDLYSQQYNHPLELLQI